MRLPMKPPSLQDVLDQLSKDPQAMARLFTAGIGPTVAGKYRHWDKLRYLEPPEGLSHEEWWAGVKFARQHTAHDVPLLSVGGSPFTYTLPDPVLEMLHQVDQFAGGHIGMSEAVTNPATRDRYLVTSLIEEAITSSQLEGAHTSYAVAKEMLRSGRPARDKSEQMIFNNYVAMNSIRDGQDDPLTPEFVCRLHKTLTHDTLDEPSAAGRPQRAGEQRVHVFDPAGTLIHRPPAAEELPDRLVKLCDFSNGGGVSGFLHPVLRAIIVHFWLAYDHPFVDGNGRTARALFYRSMIRNGYWLSEFLSISSILKRAPAQYSRAFLYVETDEGDLTYFLLYHLRVICRAIEALQTYLSKKMLEIAQTESLLRESDLNHRQTALISHALRNPGASYSFRSHATSHRVVHQTARTDLLQLEERGLLRKRKSGRAYVFRPTEDLAKRLRPNAVGG